MYVSHKVDHCAPVTTVSCKVSKLTSATSTTRPKCADPRHSWEDITASSL